MLKGIKGCQRKFLRAFQVNIGRGQANHDLALALALDDKSDIILIQEPWTLARPGKRVSKHHSDFDTFSLTDTWDIRPCVLSYVRKGRNLYPEHFHPKITYDIYWVKLAGVEPPITIVIVNRPPQET